MIHHRYEIVFEEAYKTINANFINNLEIEEKKPQANQKNLVKKHDISLK